MCIISGAGKFGERVFPFESPAKLERLPEIKLNCMCSLGD